MKNKKIREKSLAVCILCSLLFFICNLFFACSDPAGPEETGGLGKFTINLNGRSSRAAYPPTDPVSISELKFVVKFSSGGSVVKTFTAERSDAIQGSIEIGTYDVTLEIFLLADNSLFVEGEAILPTNPVTIVEGNNTINIGAYKSVVISPNSAVITAGQDQQFSAAVHKNAAASITWTVSGGNGSSGIDQSGRLSVGATERSGTVLTVTASSGSNPVRRGAVSVEITDKVNAIAPSLSGLPDPIQSYDAGAAASTLSVTVTNQSDITAQHSETTTGSGTNALTYQWYRNSSDSSSGGTMISGATGLSFTPPTTTAGITYYYMVATNTIRDNADGGTKRVSTPSVVVMVVVLQPVVFSSVTANNTAGTTTSLTLNFSPAINGLTLENINLTGPATATSLSGSGTSYSLGVTTTAAGTVTVSVTAPSGYRITGSPKTVNVVYPVAVTLNSVSASGSPFTTSLALNFSQAISGLTADDITLTPVTGAATKVSLSGSGPAYTLTVNTTAAGSISVAVAKVGYTVSGSPKTVTVAYTSLPQYAITLSENGTMTFPSAVYGYGVQSAISVTVSNSGYANTGALTIALSGGNAGDFTLSKTSITDIASSGNDTFTVTPKTGLAVGTYTAAVTVSGTNVASKSFNVSFTVTSKSVTFSVNPVGALRTTSLDINFSSAVSGLSASDISLGNSGGAAAKNGSLSGGPMAYSLPVNTTAAGNITVTITAPPGFTITSTNPVTVAVAYTTYTVTFNSMGGTAVSPMSGVAYGNTITAPAAPTSSYGAFVNWYSDSGRTTLFNFGTDIVTDNITLYAKWNAAYSIGATGPGGGIIFYGDEMGFTMTDNNSTAYYLEAAPADMGSTLAWASGGYTTTDIPGTETAIGAGRKNTAIILTADSTAPAALACDTYSNNSKNDWFLPSKDELDQLYNNRVSVGGFTGSIYFSSSQYSNITVPIRRFSDGYQGNFSKNMSYDVRAIRAF